MCAKETSSAPSAIALGSAVHEVRAERSGLILVLRTFPRVLKGDMVAVILETDRKETP